MSEDVNVGFQVRDQLAFIVLRSRTLTAINSSERLAERAGVCSTVVKYLLDKGVTRDDSGKCIPLPVPCREDVEKVFRAIGWEPNSDRNYGPIKKFSDHISFLIDQQFPKEEAVATKLSYPLTNASRDVQIVQA